MAGTDARPLWRRILEPACVALATAAVLALAGVVTRAPSVERDVATLRAELGAQRSELRSDLQRVESKLDSLILRR